MTPPNLSGQALRDIYKAVDDMVAGGAGLDYAERFALVAAETAEKIARRPLLGHRRTELLPGRFRFRAVRGFDYLLVYNAEHPERRVLRVVHMARDLGPLLAGISMSEDLEEP